MFYQDNQTIRIVAVDDHELIRMGVKTLFQSDPNLQLVGEADNFSDALWLSQQLSPQLILLDMKLKNNLVTERIPELLSACPSCKILMLTATDNAEMHLSALKLGAVGVFIKSQPANQLLKAIHCVHRGEVWFDNSLATGLLHSLKQNLSKAETVEYPNKNLLSRRELDVAYLAVKGLSAKKIAAQLSISEKTVRNQLGSIYSKLGLANQIELVLQAKKLGLLCIETARPA